MSSKSMNNMLFAEALLATAEHRGSRSKLKNTESIIKQISDSSDLKKAWEKYQRTFAYAKEISYDSIITVIKKLLEPIIF